MNVLLILSALKKGWEYTKGFLALVDGEDGVNNPDTNNKE